MGYWRRLLEVACRLLVGATLISCSESAQHDAEGSSGAGGAAPFEAGPDTCRGLSYPDSCAAAPQSSEFANGLCVWVETFQIDDTSACLDLTVQYTCEFLWASNAGSTPTSDCGGFSVWWKREGETLVVLSSAQQDLPDDWRRCRTTDGEECACGCEAFTQ